MHQFWADDFDMDLLKVFPDLQEILGRFAFVPVWTLGHETFGRLNHPSTWNTHGAYLWLKEPTLERSQEGWTRIHGCVSSNPLVQCTWIEFLRDCWPHSYGFVVLPKLMNFVPIDLATFDTIMYHQRGWRVNQPNFVRAKNSARRWVINSTIRLSLLLPEAAV